ncbi:MAG: CBU_0592 family membrane protein [Thermoplasmatota archaeon]
MEFSTIIGSVGVGLLLLAFLLNLFKFVSQESKLYIILNILGAGVAMIASVMIWFVPFIVLELIWVMVGIAGLIRVLGKRKEEAPAFIIR